MKQKHFDCIVVGAGPAGSTAALTIARENMSVLLIERGTYPGAKKLFAGLIHRIAVDEILPGFWEKAPVERPIVADELWMLDQTSAVKIGFTGLNYAKPPYNKFSVLRYKWDNWLAQEAVKAGASLLNKTVVRHLLTERSGLRSKKFVGVELDSGEQIYTNVIILAEGSNAPLTEEAGLRSHIFPKNLSLQAIELFYLPANKIEERFNLGTNEGAVIGAIGYPLAGAVGKVGIWLQKDTIALTVGALLDQIIARKYNPFHLITQTKKHPLIKRMLKGCELLAYGSHTIPKGGFNTLPQLFSDGIMVAGDAAGFINGRRGSDLAMLSGMYAGETAVQAHAKGDYSAKVLNTYFSKIQKSFFYKDMKEDKGTSDYFHNYKDSDFLLSKAANELAYEFFRIDLNSKEEKLKTLENIALSVQPVVKTTKDLYNGLQHWGFF